ncbi:hypothetical protein HYR69_09170 [Candidatus Sumerlaeota bacterium]|nr:hypothetical protein [Candidatus Sumerlaeota bacterium]
MPRFARLILPGYAYNVTHRGDRRGGVFHCDKDRDHYLLFLGEYAREYGMEIWAYA